MRRRAQLGLGLVEGSVGGGRVRQRGVRVHPIQILHRIEHVFDTRVAHRQFEIQLSLVDKGSGHRPAVDSGFRQAQPPKGLALNHRRGDQASASAGLVRRRRNPHHIVHAIKAAYTAHGTVRLKRRACPVDACVTTTAFTVASIR